MTPGEGERQARLRVVLEEVYHERAQQHAKWGEQNLPFWEPSHNDVVISDSFKVGATVALRLGVSDWKMILKEEFLEVMGESFSRNPLALRAELIQLAAVAVQMVEAIDRSAEEAARVGTVR